MMNKQIKQIVFMCVLLAQVAGSTVAMAPAQEPGILATLAQDAVSLVKWTGYGIASAFQGLGNTYLAARKYPAAALAVAVGVPLLGRWITLRNYAAHIKPIKDKYKHPMRYSAWATDFWQNHSNFMKDRDKVIGKFAAHYGYPTAQTVAEIQAEQALLETDLRTLERNYLIGRLPLNFSLYNINDEFDKVLKLHVNGKGPLLMSPSEMIHLDNDMEKQYKSKWLPYILLSFNYGNAAKTWWELKKKKFKLQALLDHVEGVVGLGARIPVPQGSIVHQDRHVNLIVNGEQA